MALSSKHKILFGFIISSKKGAKLWSKASPLQLGFMKCPNVHRHGALFSWYFKRDPYVKEETVKKSLKLYVQVRLDLVASSYVPTVVKVWAGLPRKA